MEPITKPELFAKIEGLKRGENESLGFCIDFFLNETRGIWHGRARAKIARNLKPEQLNMDDKGRVVSAISERLLSGNFSEQFRDQLNLALRIDTVRVIEIATYGLSSQKEHVRRLSKWIIDRCRRKDKQGQNSMKKN